MKTLDTSAESIARHIQIRGTKHIDLMALVVEAKFVGQDEIHREEYGGSVIYEGAGPSKEQALNLLRSFSALVATDSEGNKFNAQVRDEQGNTLRDSDGHMAREWRDVEWIRFAETTA